MISRLVLFLISLTLAGVSLAAPGTPQTKYMGSSANAGNTPWVDSISAACDVLWTRFHATNYGSSFTVHDFVGNVCYAGTGANPHYETLGSVQSALRCPADWSTAPVGGVCPEPCPIGSFSANVEMGAGAGGALARPRNVLGCAVDVVNVTKCWQYADTGQKVCSIDFYRTGAVSGVGEISSNIDGSTAPKTPVPTIKTAGSSSGSCPGGTVSGGIDSGGVPICIGTGTNPATSASSQPVVTQPAATTTATDGTTTTVKQSSSVNKDGSTTTVKETTTTSPAGVVTTSKDVSTSVIPAGNVGAGKDGVPTGGGAPGTPGAAGPAGAAGTSGTNGKDALSMCAENPLLSICRNSSVSGSCEAIACEGDAIQCATLRAAAAMECKGRKDDDDLRVNRLTPIGQAGIDGTDPLKATFPSVANATVVQAPSSLDDSGWLGGGSCFADKSFVLMGKTIVMPFSKTCDSLLVLRYALMVIAALVSFKIISGAVLS